jgi:hypothetical protein
MPTPREIALFLRSDRVEFFTIWSSGGAAAVIWIVAPVLAAIQALLKPAAADSDWA